VVTNEQLYIAVGVPLLFNATLIGLVIALFAAKIGKVESKMGARFDAVNTRFDAVNTRFDGINTRFDDTRDLWRAELRRVEEVLDARLKHIEERR
jgi:hypothetical protein